MRRSWACSAAPGFADTSLYHRPFSPCTERTKTSPSTVTTQMIVRCTGASSSLRVSILTSLVSSRSCKVSASNEPFTSGSFPGDVSWGSSSSGPLLLHRQLRAEDLVVEFAVAQELFVGADRRDLAV